MGCVRGDAVRGRPSIQAGRVGEHCGAAKPLLGPKVFLDCENSTGHVGALQHNARVGRLCLGPSCSDLSLGCCWVCLCRALPELKGGKGQPGTWGWQPGDGRWELGLLWESLPAMGGRDRRGEALFPSAAFAVCS